MKALNLLSIPLVGIGLAFPVSGISNPFSYGNMPMGQFPPLTHSPSFPSFVPSSAPYRQQFHSAPGYPDNFTQAIPNQNIQYRQPAYHYDPYQQQQAPRQTNYRTPSYQAPSYQAQNYQFSNINPLQQAPRQTNYRTPNYQAPSYQAQDYQFSNINPFGNSFSPTHMFSNNNVPSPWKNSGQWNPWKNGNNSNMPFFPNQNSFNNHSNKKKAWGNTRNIWPDFYTGFTEEFWDQGSNAPYDMGRMPGGWRAPSLSSPDPVTVGDAVVNQFPPIMEEMGNMMDFAN